MRANDVHTVTMNTCEYRTYISPLAKDKLLFSNERLFKIVAICAYIFSFYHNSFGGFIFKYSLIHYLISFKKRKTKQKKKKSSLGLHARLVINSVAWGKSGY